MNWVGIGLLGWVLVVAMNPVIAQKKDENAFLKIADVRYATHTKANPKLNMLNVYMPKKGSNSPLIIWVHGGSLALGDKDNVLHKAEYFTARGYVFAAVNYRVSPHVKQRTSAQDVADAIVWLYENATHYSADPATVFLMGHSAGAQLIALICADETYLKQAGGSRSMIDGVVLLDGVGYDIPLFMKEAPSKMKEWGHDALGKTRKEWEQVSPILYVEEGRGVPPVMIAYTGEREGAEKEAIAFAKKLSDANVKNKVFNYAKKNHNTINRELGKINDKPTEDVIRFLQEIHYIAINPVR